MAASSEWTAVQAWLDAVHPEDATAGASDVFQKYFERLTPPLHRIVGARLSPEERGRHPLVRDRRRRYAELARPEELSVAAQREVDPQLWWRIAGHGDEEEEEEEEEDQAPNGMPGHKTAEDAISAQEGELSARVGEQATPASDASRPGRGAPRGARTASRDPDALPELLHTEGPAGRLHSAYLQALHQESIGDASADPEAVRLFERTIVDRFISGKVRCWPNERGD